MTRARTRTLWATPLLLALLIPTASAAPTEFEAFDPASCPDCPLPATYADQIVLTTKEEIRGQIVAENEAFYVMTRYGQIRVVPKAQVSDVKFGAAKPSGLTDGDHILLRNGHVIVGTIIEDKKAPGLFRISSRLGNKAEFVAFKSEVAALYRNGRRTEFDPGQRWDYKVGSEYRNFPTR